MDSPISSLSSELIVLIVEHLLNNSAALIRDPIACGPDDDTVFASEKIIQCVAQISTFWRAICVGNPLWWSTVSVVHPWSLDNIKLRLERAQQVPLDLRLFGHLGYTTHNRKVPPFRRKGLPPYLPPHPPTLAMYTELFEYIFPALERCRVLHIRGIFADENRVLPFYMLQHMVNTQMPLLEHLVWEGELNQFNKELSQPDCNTFFRYAPKLQQLRLVGIDFNRFRDPTSLSFPSSSLTALHLSRGCSSSLQVSSSLLRSILAGYPSLSTLAIYDDILTFDDIQSPITPCTAPSLKLLFILGNMLSVSQLLLFLHAPQMTELVITPAVHTDLEDLLKDDHSTNSNQHLTSADSDSDSDATSNSVTRITCRTDRFPKLTTLTLAPAFPQDMIHTLIYASQCFPLIERLILVLPPQGYLEDFVDSFTPAILARHGAHKITFPHLRDLALHLGLESVPILTAETPVNNPKRPSQVERLSRWSQAIYEVRRIRDAQLGVPLNNVFVDECTFRALNIGSPSNLNGKAPDCDKHGIEVGDFWEDRRRSLLFAQVTDVFMGSPSEGF